MSVREGRGESLSGGIRPTEAQRRYLERGLTEPGGKLPLFDRQGRQIPHKTIETCIAHGWAAPWFANPIKPDWLVCKLTPAGYQALGQGTAPDVPDDGEASVDAPSGKSGLSRR
jgi:hypothetical protein